MNNMLPFYYYRCPYLLRRSMQERKCMSKAEMLASAQKAQIPETYNISFNPIFAQVYNGVYNIDAVAGDPTYFIIYTKNSKGLVLEFNSDQMCGMQLKGPKKPIPVTGEPSTREIS